MGCLPPPRQLAASINSFRAVEISVPRDLSSVTTRCFYAPEINRPMTNDRFLWDLIRKSQSPYFSYFSLFSSIGRNTSNESVSASQEQRRRRRRRKTKVARNYLPRTVGLVNFLTRRRKWRGWRERLKHEAFHRWQYAHDRKFDKIKRSASMRCRWKILFFLLFLPPRSNYRWKSNRFVFPWKLVCIDFEQNRRKMFVLLWKRFYSITLFRSRRDRNINVAQRSFKKSVHTFQTVHILWTEANRKYSVCKYHRSIGCESNIDNLGWHWNKWDDARRLDAKRQLFKVCGWNWPWPVARE